MGPNVNKEKVEQGSGGEAEWRVADLLEVKSRGGRLTEDQVAFLVQKITDRTLDDCQLGALLMAIKLQGMGKEETLGLTRSMRDSGKVLSWPAGWRAVDKHSTGGVGDKVSLPLAPALAALGLHVPMISGRGLGHTGGTLDKLESIPGFHVCLTEEEMKAALTEARCCIVGQTADIVPADRRMYSARDISSTVQSMPLIVSSILSKKAVEGISVLVMDVKYGPSAFMTTIEDASQLSRTLVDVSSSLGITTVALVTKMDAPIGRTIGNALEVREGLECLRGRGPSDLLELVTNLGGELAVGGGVVETLEEGKQAVRRVLHDGSALAAFSNMMQKQGVTREVAEELCGDRPNYSVLPQAAQVTPILAQATGVVVALDSMLLAKVSASLGAGRSRIGEPINYAVGIVLLKVVGEGVEEGEAWAELHHDQSLPKATTHTLQAAITLDPARQPFAAPSLICGRFS